MMSNKRLDAIEKSLAAKQVVLKWVEDSNRFESLAEYVEAEQSKIGPDEPIWTELVRSIQERLNGMDPKATQLAIHKATREVAFPYWIRVLLADEIASQIPILETLNVACTVITRLAIKEKEINQWGANIDRFNEFKYSFHLFFSLVLSLDCAVKYLQSKYFYDCPILWRSSAKVIEFMMERCVQLASFWSNCFYLTLPDKTRSEEIDDELEIPFETDWDALKKSIDPIERARFIVAHARSRASAAVGDRDAAVAFLIPVGRSKPTKK